MNYLICGQNSLFLDERIDSLFVENDPSGFGATVIDVQSSSIEEIAAACHASPFFGTARVVVLRQPIAQPRNSDELSADDDEVTIGRIRWPDLLRVLTTTPESTVLIVRHDGSLAQGHFVRKAIRQLGWTIEQYDIPRGSDLLAWVSSRADSRGFTFAPGAVERMLDLLHPAVWREGPTRYDTGSPNPLLIACEIDKLALAASEGTVSVDIVDSLVADRTGYRAFALNDAVFEGRTDRALIELELMIAAGEAPERMIAHIASDIAGISWARHVTESTSRDAAAAAGVSEVRLRTLGRRRLSHDAMRDVAEVVRRGDVAVKSGLTPQASALIAPLVAELSEVVRSQHKRR